MLCLTNPIRNYHWGSREAIALLQGRPVPSPEPEAELWIGSHPAAPSLVDGREPLEGLPYLLKVLAAGQPLSLQAHPDRERAQTQYAAGHGSYVDSNHKPEMLVALTPFEALCGFKAPDASATLFAGLAIPTLTPVVTALSQDRLREAVELLMNWPVCDRAGAFLAE